MDSVVWFRVVSLFRPPRYFSTRRLRAGQRTDAAAALEPPRGRWRSNGERAARRRSGVRERASRREERSEDRETARGSRSDGDRGRASRAACLSSSRGIGDTHQDVLAREAAVHQRGDVLEHRAPAAMDCSVGRSASMSSFTSVATGPARAPCRSGGRRRRVRDGPRRVRRILPSFLCVQARGASCPLMSRALESASEADPSAPTAPSTSRNASPVDLSRSSAARRPAPATATLPSARSRENSPRS